MLFPDPPDDPISVRLRAAGWVPHPKPSLRGIRLWREPPDHIAIYEEPDALRHLHEKEDTCPPTT